MLKRRRFKQAFSLGDRLAAFAAEMREQASALPASAEKDDMLRRARQAETTIHLQDWLSSSGLQAPT